MNYKHLYYFWQVVQCGGVSRAAEHLHTTAPSLSAQIRLLEERLGKTLFSREGRRLVLTEAGRMALGYAEEIFSLGAELEQVLAAEGEEGYPLSFRVGVADSIPNPIVHGILQPALSIGRPVRMQCHEWHVERLLTELAAHKLDMLLTDTPLPPGFSVKAFVHRLGDSPLGFFATPALAQQCEGVDFPACLDHVPLLALGKDSSVSESFLRWVRANGLHPRVVADFDDSGLMMTFGAEGAGVFMAPVVLASQICRRFGVELLGVSREITQSFHAITLSRRLDHPCVAAVIQHAREEVFVTGLGV